MKLTNHDTSNLDVAIVGGGLAGLTAAALLATNGHRAALGLARLPRPTNTLAFAWIVRCTIPSILRLRDWRPREALSSTSPGIELDREGQIAAVHTVIATPKLAGVRFEPV